MKKMLRIISLLTIFFLISCDKQTNNDLNKKNIYW